MNVYTVFEVSSFTRSWGNRVTPQNWAVPGYAHAPFSPKSLMGFCSDGPCECIVLVKFEVCSFTHSWDNSNWSFGRGLQTSSLGKKALGYGMVPFERALVTSYRPYIVTFRLSTRFRDIMAFALQHTTFSHPTSSLPKISPCSPGITWMAFGLRRANVLG